MALLAVRIGNDHTVMGLLEGAEVVADWRVGSEPQRTADEWGFLLRGLLGTTASSRPIDGVVVCSAVPAIQHTWREMATVLFPGVPQVVVQPGIRTGIPMRVDNPREVGADRIVNAVALAELTGGPAVAVDFGTATTFDAVNSKGEYVGGAIAPGIETSLDALGRKGAQLRTVELVRPRSVIARNTVEAMQSGLVLGMAALVDGMVKRIAAELGATNGIPVVATGHLAPLVVDECSTITAHDPHLPLHGLRLVYERNG